MKADAEGELRMRNFVFISPNFPDSYYRFCKALKNNGVTVLGIGDTPFYELNPELRESLAYYYYVSDLKNMDEKRNAMNFFINNQHILLFKMIFHNSTC